MQTNQKQPLLPRLLAGVERAGNALPHPAILFLILTGVVLLVSGLISALGVTAVHPVTKATLTPLNLFSVAGLHLLLTEMVKNFASFAPLGSVLVAMLGFSLAEKSGLLSTLLRGVVLRSPRALLTPSVLLAGVLSHTAGDIGYVLLIPLAAMAFHSAGLNPLAGLAICFAGVSGGFSANFLVSSVDPLLAGLTQEAARILDPAYSVNPLVNYYFMAASSFLIIGVGTLVANKITIPFLGPYRGEAPGQTLQRLSKDEKRGLRAAGIVALLLVLVLLAGLIPSGGFLRDPANPDVLQSPVLKGVVAVIFFFAALTGLAYGFTARTLRSTNDVIQAMQDAMATMAPYLVLVFFAAQFISFFNASNMGLIFAIHGSDFFKGLGLGQVPLMLGFILFTCVLDLFIGSASAKWALMAPVFVPMFMLLGTSPELTQASYRVADSVVNIISPLMSYFPLILAFAAKYDPKARVGTVIALMLPYSLAFLVLWSLMLFAWMMLGWPLGPGAGLVYPPLPAP
ncbi:MAG: AbgT family transporter [Bdellovibrio sp.]|jgi:aminobenzoyl-glutamate transport protein